MSSLLSRWTRPGRTGSDRPGRSLVARLLALLMVGALVVYFIVNVGLWWASTQLLEDNLEKQASRWLSDLDELSTPLYASSRKRHLPQIEQRIKNFPEIASIRYYDASGRNVVSEYGEPHKLQVPAPTPEQIERLKRLDDTERNYLMERVHTTGHYLRFLAPIHVKSIRSDGLLGFELNSRAAERVQILGFIELGLDSGYYREQLTNSLLSASIIVAGLLLLALVVGRQLILRALAPLMALQAPLARLANGETDVKVARAKDREIAVISDALNATISALRERDEALRKLAEHDGLTGLVNRGVFMRELEREIARAAQDGVESAVFFIDLDQFKYVNDTLGHPAGDRLLIQVAELLKSRSRASDVVSRFGGDEFTILARRTSPAAALEMAQTYNQILRELRVAEGERGFSVNGSIGVAMIDSAQCSAEDVLSHADMACYQAKLRGRNRFHVHDAGDENKSQMTQDIGWSERIKTMIAQDRFRLVYQPIVNVAASGKEIYEVLLRMPSENGELVPPSAFLPVAQRFGLMVEIDRWVIVHALQALAGYRIGGRDVVFSINLAGESLEDASLLPLVKESLATSGVPASAIIFEITEQSAVRHMDKAQRLIQGLADLGCRFALDDFGTGFSSFSYLKDLPVDFIKIDGSFVRNMSKDAIDETMVASIVQIARALGKLTVAEFVSDERTVALLKESGVDYLQGYFLGMPAERLPVALRVVAESRKNAS